MDEAVTLAGPQLLERMTAGKDERIRPILAVIDHAAAGRPATNLEPLAFAESKLLADEPDLLRVTERHRRRAPAIMPEPRGRFLRVAWQEEKIDRHVLGRAGDPRREDVKTHGLGQAGERARID